jgi:chromosome segregation ATPase
MPEKAPTMSISNFNEVAEELLKLSKEIQQLQKQLNDEQQQRLQMEQTIQQLLDKLGKKKD